jgi:hypothetical protein
VHGEEWIGIRIVDDGGVAPRGAWWIVFACFYEHSAPSRAEDDLDFWGGGSWVVMAFGNPVATAPGSDVFRSEESGR